MTHPSVCKPCFLWHACQCAAGGYASCRFDSMRFTYTESQGLPVR